MTLGAEQERTEVWRGRHNIIEKSLEVLRKIRAKYDLCIDSSGPETITKVAAIKESYLDLSARAVKIRVITEVTTTNLMAVRELMQFGELRHLDGLVGNFVVADGTDYAGVAETPDSVLTELVVSNVQSFVKQQQYLFNMLWQKARPVEERIGEIEGAREPEVTEVVIGWEDIFRRNVENFQNERSEVVSCCDSVVPAIIVNSPMFDASADFVRRGGRIRMITEITSQNLAAVKQLLSIHDVRHIPDLKLNFGCSEMVYVAPIAVSATNPNPKCIFSNSKDLITQHQYLFETLWSQAIPAGTRIKELERGIEPETIRLIRDTQQSIKLAFDVMLRARNELLVLFATSHTFSLAISAGASAIYKQISEAGVKVRILVPAGANIEEKIAEMMSIVPSVMFRTSDENLNTRLTILISDRKELMSWELKDENSGDPYEAGGIATYSNYESIAGSYAVIFENLWMITEFAHNLRIANANLASKEAAMQDFINTAAHELRTPIQPILGLSQVLRDLSGDDPRKTELLDAILRNSKRLARLQEDILDVSRIQSNLFKLNPSPLSIEALIEESILLFRSQGDPLDFNPKVNIVYEGGLGRHIMANLDKSRMIQVMSNLFSNALKFMKEGDIRVRASVAGGGSSVIVSVADSGAGIDQEIMPKLFTRFATKSKQGTGLGLYICKSIIEAHRGRIWGENNKGSPGATFSFELPLASKS